MKLNVDQARSVYMTTLVPFEGDIDIKLWRKLDPPPAPWTRRMIHRTYWTASSKVKITSGGYVRFSCWYNTGQPAPSTDWLPDYKLRMSLIIK